MRNYRKLWVIETRIGPHKWMVLPNTVEIRKCHCNWDIKELRELHPSEEFRVVAYVPEAK